MGKQPESDQLSIYLYTSHIKRLPAPSSLHHLWTAPQTDPCSSRATPQRSTGCRQAPQKKPAAPSTVSTSHQESTQLEPPSSSRRSRSSSGSTWDTHRLSASERGIRQQNNEARHRSRIEKLMSHKLVPHFLK